MSSRPELPIALGAKRRDPFKYARNKFKGFLRCVRITGLRSE